MISKSTSLLSVKRERDATYVALTLAVVENGAVLGSRTHRFSILHDQDPAEVLKVVEAHLHDGLALPAPSSLEGTTAAQDGEITVSYPFVSDEERDLIIVEAKRA